jgi:acetyl esterase/lipase
MRARMRVATIVGTVVAAAAPISVTEVSADPVQVAQVISNIAYAPAQPAGSRGHLLDLYLPDGATTPRPLVIWHSGSAWTSDDGKSGAASIANVLNPRGYAVAGVSIRSSSQAKFPAQAHDIKSAIRFLRSRAGEFRLDPNRFAVMGNSSGGWVADMAALTGGVAALEGTIGVVGVSSAVQAGVAFFGPTDFLQMNAQGSSIDHNAANSPESQLMGCAIQTCAAQVRQANPITYVDGNDPPMMLLHGQADPLVPHGQSVLLQNALRAACTDAQFISVPGAGHSTSGVMSPSRFGTQTVRTTTNCQETTRVGSPNPTWDTIVGFLNTALGAGAPDPDPNPPGTCRVGYTANGWNTGFTAEVTVTNTGTTAINGWSLAWTWTGNQRVTSAWNAAVTQPDTRATATNMNYNATIAPGTGVTFGFQATFNGTNNPPTQFTLNNIACTTN